MILCIDPGARRTGWAVLELQGDELPRLVDHGDDVTTGFVEELRRGRKGLTRAVVEDVGHYGTGMPAGADVFETCVLIGRMVEILRPLPVERVRRQSVKTRLCGRATAKDPHVRQALIDRWGGNLAAIGGKRCPSCKGKGWRGRGRPACTECRGSGWDVPPGPLHGVSGHTWSALAVGVYAWEVGR